MRLFILFLCVLLSACRPTTSPQKPSIIHIPQPATSQPISANQPIPQIDDGGHTSLIRDVAFSKDGRYLVSAGDDKLVRIWDIAQQKTVRTIRGQIGVGNEGKIYAMALSPDNRYLAVSGSFYPTDPVLSSAIRLYDFASGTLISLLKGHTNVVRTLAFSPDGRWLASGQGGSSRQTAIIWNLHSGQLHQKLSGHTAAVHAVAFTADSQRLVTASADHDLRLWQVVNGALISILSGHTDKVRTIAVSPDNQIFSAGRDRSIRRWDAVDGRDLGMLVQDQGSRVGSLSISPDGRWLLSGAASAPHAANLYRLSDGERIHQYTGNDNIVLATAFSPDSSRVATAGGNQRSIHIWHTQSGSLQHKLSGQGGVIWSVGFSADGRYLAWGKTFDKKHINRRGPLEYQLRLPDDDPLGQPQPIKPQPTKSYLRTGLGRVVNFFLNYIRPPMPRAYLHAQTRHGDWQLVQQKIGSVGRDAILAIQRDGKTKYRIQRDSTNGFDHRAFTFTPDGRHIISGGVQGVLSYFARDGRHLADFVGHTGDIWAVAVSPDGRFLVSGAGDKTLRLWRVESQQLLLTLFHGDEDWVAWMPQGYFSASPGGEEMIGWQVNHGPSKAADYVSGKQVRKYFYRPDIIDQAIQLGNTRQAIRQAEETGFSLDDLLADALPKFHIKETRVLRTAGDPILRIGLQVEPGTVQSYQVYLDNRYIQESLGTRSNYRQKHDKVIEVPLPGGAAQNTLNIVAQDTRGISTSQSVEVNVPANFLSNQAGHGKGDLYLISIGVNQYPHLNRNLNYARQDADAFHRWVMQNHARDFNQVHAVLLHDGAPDKPTRAAIHSALARLKQSRPNDTVMVFLAGHGGTVGRDYYFLGADTKAAGEHFAPETAVPWQVIQDSLQQAMGQRILVVDTCYAEGAFNPSLANDASAAGIAIFSATDSADYVAEEQSAVGHGVLTYSLLEGLKGHADSPYRPDRQITLAELKFFVKNEVLHHTGSRQRPAIYLTQQAEDYVIARLGAP